MATITITIFTGNGRCFPNENGEGCHTAVDNFRTSSDILTSSELIVFHYSCKSNCAYVQICLRKSHLSHAFDRNCSRQTKDSPTYVKECPLLYAAYQCILRKLVTAYVSKCHGFSDKCLLYFARMPCAYVTECLEPFGEMYRECLLYFVRMLCAYVTECFEPFGEMYREC